VRVLNVFGSGRDAYRRRGEQCRADGLRGQFFRSDYVHPGLEHLQNPGRVVDECHRVLKPGGILIAKVPSIYPEHGYTLITGVSCRMGCAICSVRSPCGVLGELNFAESLANVNCFYGQVLTGRMGNLGKVINPA